MSDSSVKRDQFIHSLESYKDILGPSSSEILRIILTNSFLGKNEFPLTAVFSDIIANWQLKGSFSEATRLSFQIVAETIKGLLLSGKPFSEADRLVLERTLDLFERFASEKSVLER